MLDYACTKKTTQTIIDLDKEYVFWIWRQYLAVKELQALHKTTLGCKIITNWRNGLRKKIYFQ